MLPDGVAISDSKKQAIRLISFYASFKEEMNG